MMTKRQLRQENEVLKFKLTTIEEILSVDSTSALALKEVVASHAEVTDMTAEDIAAYALEGLSQRVASLGAIEAVVAS